MPERQSLLTAQVSGRIQPAAAPDVRAPSGAFGDFSGQQAFGGAIQNASSVVSSVTAERVQQIHKQIDRRDASDISAKYRLSVEEQGLELRDAYQKATEAGLSGAALSKVLDDQEKLGLVKINKKLEAMKELNPKMYERIVTSESMTAAWGGQVANYRQHAMDRDSELRQADRYETTTRLDEINFAKVATSPSDTLTLYGNVAKDINDRRSMFTTGQNNQRLAVARSKVGESLMGAAMLSPDKGVIDTAARARDQGIISQTDYAQIENRVKKGLDPAVHAGEIHLIASQTNEKLASGKQLGLEASNQILNDEASQYQTPTGVFEGAVKPRIIALMSGELNSEMASGFFDGMNYNTATQLASELSDPSSTKINQLFLYKFRNLLHSQLNSTPGLQAKIVGAADFTPSTSDLAGYRQAVLSAVQRQTNMVTSGHSYELYRNDAGMKQVLDTHNPGQIVRAQKAMYESGGIPEEYRVYGHPDEINALREMASRTGEADANQTAAMVGQMIDTYGKEAFRALKSIAQNTQDNPAGGIVRFAAQQIMAETDTDARNIASLVPQIAQAVSWGNSVKAKALFADPAAAKQLKEATDMYDAAFSTAYAKEFNGKKAYAQWLDGKLESSPLTSPLGQAAIREGTYSSIYNTGLALTKYYAFAQKDATMNPSQAADKARKVLSTAYIPVATNGGSNDHPVYGFAPPSNTATDWISPGSKGAYNDQHHFAQIDAASFDSMFFAGDPKLQSLGNIQWSFNAAMASFVSGPHIGEHWDLAHMPNLDTTFFSLVRNNPGTKAFSGSQIDFKGVGIMMPGKDGKDVFVPLSDDRVITGVIPDDMREKVRQVLKRVDQTDIAGRNQVVLANTFQREANEQNRAWDMYVSSSRNYLGNSGTLDKTAPRAQLMYRANDGTVKPFSVSFKDASDRREALMAAQSFFNRPGANDKLRKEIIQKRLDEAAHFGENLR